MAICRSSCLIWATSGLSAATSRAVRKFWSLGRESEVGLAVSDLREDVVEVVAGEGPLERAGDLPVVLGEREESVGERVEVGEVVRGERFALHDREVELDLVQPGGVHGEVDQPGARVGLGHPGRCAPQWLEPLSTIQNTRRADR